MIEKLRYAFDAVSACAIMLFALFGSLQGSRAHQFLTIEDTPSWPLTEHYVPIGDTRFVAVKYKF